MDTKDVNGQELSRGDHVVMSEAMVADNPALGGGLGVGQIIHVFPTGIHVQFNAGIRIGNSGLCFRKVTREL